MIGVNTNVLARMFVTDNIDQQALAAAFFKARTFEDPVFISSTVLLEFVGMLQKSYGFRKTEIVDALKVLLRSADVVIEHSGQLQHALDLIEAANVGIADAFIAAINADHGCRATVTFDRHAAKRIPEMELLT